MLIPRRHRYSVVKQELTTAGSETTFFHIHHARVLLQFVHLLVKLYGDLVIAYIISLKLLVDVFLIRLRVSAYIRPIRLRRLRYIVLVFPFKVA